MSEDTGCQLLDDLKDFISDDIAIAQYSISNITVEVYDKKHIPNRFIRFMQKHILGVRWEIF